MKIIARQYLAWHRYADSLGTTTLFPHALDAFLEHTDDETIKEIARDVVDNARLKDLCLVLFQRYDLESLLKALEIFDKFGNNYRLQVSESELDSLASKKVSVQFSFYHTRGAKWSLFIGEVLHNELLRLKLDHSYDIGFDSVAFSDVEESR